MNAKHMLVQAAGAVLVASVASLPTVAEVTLPEGYTRLDYIESTGSQYIDTGYCLLHDDVVALTMDAPRVQGSTEKEYHSAFGYSDGVEYVFNPQGPNVGVMRYVCRGQIVNKWHANVFNRGVSFVFTSAGMTWENADGTGEAGSLAFAAATGTTDATIPLYVFANSELGDNGTVRAAKLSVMKLRSFQVRSADGNTVKLDLIPCRDPNGVLGLYNAGSYDIPGGNFLANKGTGTFRTSDLNGTRILSIAATGAQYVDTCHRFKYNDVVTADMMIPKEQPGGTGRVYASAFGSSGSVKYLFYPRAISNNRFSIQRLGSEDWNPGGSTLDYFYDERVTFTLDWSKGLSWTNSDGTNTGSLNFTQQLGQEQATLPAFIFANSRMNPEGDITTLGPLNPSIGTLYSFDITSGDGTAQKRFVPFRRSDNRVGLLDLVEGRFYPNGNATPFDAGEDLYAVEGRTAVFDSGTYLPSLAKELAEEFDLVRKAGSGTFLAGNAAGWKALSIESGTYSVQDGVAKRQVIDGTLAIAGGVTLKVDVTSNGSDSFSAGTLDLSGASSLNRITFNVTLAEGASIGTTGVTLIESGVSEDDASKFTVTGQIPISKVVVRDGALVLQKLLLPDGYTRLDYIESTGSQYIDTGYYLLHDDVVVLTMDAPRVQGSTEKEYHSAFGYSDGVEYVFNPQGPNVGVMRYVCRGQIVNKWHANVFNRGVSFVFTPDGMTWENADGTGEAGALAFADATGTTDATIPLYVFANSKLGDNGTVVPAANAVMKLRSFQVRSADGNTVKLDLIPCRDPNGVLGLYNAGSYDIPGGNFLANKGTGTFRTSDLDGTRILSIEATGSQYIDTCHKFKYNDVVTADMMFPKEQPGGTSRAYTTAFGSTASVQYLFYPRAISNNRFSIQRLGSADWSPGGSTLDYFYDERVTFTLDWSKGLSWTNSDGTNTGSLNFTQPLGLEQATLPAFIFAKSRMNPEGDITTLGPLDASVGTLYSFDITSGDGTAQKRFVPFRRSDNRVGLLDLVEGRFYPNGNATPFVAGADLYTVDGRTAIVGSGAFLPELNESFDFVRKTGAGTFSAGNAAGWKALSIEAGTYSVQDGAAKRQVIDGTLALKGGATLKVDVTPDSCDSFAAGRLDLSGASVTDRVTIDVTWLAGDVSLRDKTFKLIESGLSKEDAAKFRVVGSRGNMGVKVVDGALVLCVRSMFVIVH